MNNNLLYTINLIDLFTYPAIGKFRQPNYGQNIVDITPTSNVISSIELIGNISNIQLFIDNKFIGYISNQLQNITSDRVLMIEFKNSNQLDAWSLIEVSNVIAMLNNWKKPTLHEISLRGQQTNNNTLDTNNTTSKETHTRKLHIDNNCIENNNDSTT